MVVNNGLWLNLCAKLFGVYLIEKNNPQFENRNLESGLFYA